MAQGWKYWDNDFHEWRYFEPDESDDFVTTLYSGYKVKNDTSKLPSLKIYDLLEAGFEEVQYDDDDMDERCRTSKILKRYQHHQRVPKTALPRRKRNDKPSSSAQGQRFGLVEDRRLRRIVSNCFPTSRFSRLLNTQQQQQQQACEELQRNERDDNQKLDSKMASKFLVEIEPTIHRTPNPITFKTGLKIPNKKMCAVPTTDAVNIPNELCSEKYKLIERQNQLKRVLSATHQADHGYVTSNVLDMLEKTNQSELIRVKIKNLDDLTRANRQRNSSPLSYTIGRCQSAHLYRLDYTMQKEKTKNSHEPMTCRKLLPNMNKTGQNAKDILSNIQIDFESALAARKNGKNTYRKYANTKKWETSLREAKLAQAENAGITNNSIKITAANTIEPIIGLETESPLASRAYGRSMPPPPSPIPQSALDQPD